jgi:dsRNA-specific ribonuclease
MLFIPAIMHHISLQLLAIELNTSLFNQSIRGDLLLSAMVSRAALMDMDYERLEFLGQSCSLNRTTISYDCLGDAYLKHFTSSYLVLVHPTGSERILHHTRVEIISNESLKKRAEGIDLTAYIQIKPFVSSKWRPPNHNILPDPPKSTSGAALVADLLFDMARAAKSGVSSKSQGGKPNEDAELRQQIGGKVGHSRLYLTAV